MLVQKLNRNIYNRYAFCGVNSAENKRIVNDTKISSQKQSSTPRIEQLKENFAQVMLLAGDGGFIVNQSLDKETKNSFKKSNPILDKLLFVFMGACVLITIVDIVLAIKEYLEIQKANNANK